MKYLVVDDHSLIREALRGVLLALDPQAVVHEAGTAAQLRERVSAEPAPDLVLLDLNLPDSSGLALLSELRAAHPAMAVALISGERDGAVVRQALKAGAVGFIPKSEPREVLSRALALILAGGVYVPREALGGTVEPTAGPAVTCAPSTAADGSVAAAASGLGLTERQLQVLALVLEGRPNKLICRELNLAEPTVKNHVTAILRALGVNSRTEAVVALTQRGWTPDRR